NNADCYTLGISIYNKPYVCTAPTGLNATNITQTSAQLNWNAVPDAASYNVQYKINIPFITLWTTISNIPTNSTTISGLIPGRSYLYRVSTNCVFGSSSGFSPNANFTTKLPGDCVKDAYENNNQAANATNFTFFGTDVKAMIEVGSDNDWYKFTTDLANPYIKINLTTLPENYQLELYKANGAGNPGATPVATSYNTGTASEFIDFNGPQATVGTYFVKVFSEGSAKDTVNCYTLNIVKYPAPPTCDAPSGLTVDNITPISAKLMWAGDVDATIYYVRYRKVGTTTWTEQQVFAPTTELIVTGLTEQTNYEFQVKSYCDFGESQYSTIATFSTPLVGCAFTIYEPNNGPPNAKALTPGVEIQAMIEEAGDLDVYSFSTTVANPHCKIYLTSLPKDYDIYLFKQGSAGGWGAVFPDFPVAYSKKDGIQNEYIEYQSTGATNYMVAVGPKNAQSFSPFECYKLKVELWNGPINCAIPQNIVIQNITTTTVAISWNPVPNTLGYDVFYKKVFGQTGWDVASSTDTSILITGLWHSTNYTFKVRSKCVQTLASPFSGEQSFKTLTLEDCGIYNYEPNETQAQAVPIVNSPVFGNPVTTHKAMIEHPQDEDYYTFAVEIKEEDDVLLFPTIVMTLTNLPKDYNLYLYKQGGEVIDSSVNSGIEDDRIIITVGSPFVGIVGTFKLRVSPRSSEAGGNPLNWDTTQCYHLSVHSYFPFQGTNACFGVTLKPVTYLSTTSVQLNWNTRPSTSTYDVDYKLASSPTWITLGSTTATSFIITGLQENKDYNYRVRPTLVAGVFPGCSIPWATGAFHTPYVCNDNNEPNNTIGESKLLSDEFPLEGNFSSTNDEDWFFLYNSLYGTFGDDYLDIDITIQDYAGTVNLELYNPDGNVVSSSINSLHYSVSIPNGSTSGYKVKAKGNYPNFCYRIKSACVWHNYQRISMPTSDPEKTLQLTVFPNPSNGIINIKSNANVDEEILIEISDLSGKIVFTEKYSPSSEKSEKSLDLSNLTNGLYFVRFNNGVSSQTTKITIAK
ncbi:MAG: fibronectin type III domain-containing protein, partial [Chitinophagales bacterium]|nr:fibronectin type III domain-containing protein [Chitinophagales bacterium]